MELIQLIAVLAIPFIGIGLLLLFLNRWGRKHDPMSGSMKNHWDTNGGSSRRDDTGRE